MDAPDIRSFLNPVSGRIPDCHAGYPVRPDTGYPARYLVNVQQIQLPEPYLFSFSSNKARKKFSTKINLVTLSCFVQCLQKSIIVKA
jgi:hypothetical protein